MADLYTSAGAKKGKVELDSAWFAQQPNVPVMHQVVNAQLAAKRSGTQSTKTRSEVSGGGQKPYRQKGTGRARQGTTRAVQWEGGGVALGPKPRSYRQKTPKKMIKLALAGALSDRANDNKVFVVDSFSDWTEPKTKKAKEFLKAIGAEGKTLVVLDEGIQDDYNAYLSFRNIEDVHAMVSAELSAYDVLAAQTIVFTKSCLPSLERDAKLQEEKSDEEVTA